MSAVWHKYTASSIFYVVPFVCAAFKIPNMEIDRDDPRHHAAWDAEKKVYTMQIFFSVMQISTLET